MKNIISSTPKLPTARRISNLKSLSVIALLLILDALTTGCTDKSDAAEASIALANRLYNERKSSSSPAPTIPSPSGSVKEKRLYLDASFSQKGFAGKEDTYKKVLEKFGDEGYRPYKYGSDQNGKLVKDPIAFGQEIHKPEFYNLQHNPDDKLIEEFNNNDAAGVSVLITDGVYSQRQGNSSSIAFKPLSEWLNAGKTLGMLVFRSGFDNELYSEKLCSEMDETLPEQASPVKATKTKKCWVPLTQKINRPFYAFVFSARLEDFRILQRQLKKEFPQMQSFVFGSDVLTAATVVPPKDFSVFDKRNPPELKFYWQMFDSGTFQGDAADNTINLTYALNYEMDSEFPAKTLDFSLAPAEYYKWNGEKGEFEKTDSPVVKFKTAPSQSNEPSSTRKESAYPNLAPAVLAESSPAAAQNENSRNYSNNAAAPQSSSSDANSTSTAANAESRKMQEFTLSIPRDPNNLFGFYSFRFRVGLLEMDEAISALSTADDSIPSNADKTYRFKNLIEALVNNEFEKHLADKLSPPIFVTLDYR